MKDYLSAFTVAHIERKPVQKNEYLDIEKDINGDSDSSGDNNDVFAKLGQQMEQKAE